MSVLVKVQKEVKRGLAALNDCPFHKGMAIACCCAAIASLTPVALTQLKVIERLPELPGKYFDSNRIVMAEDAKTYGFPDGVLGLASYIVTLALLIAANPSRPMLQRALRAKLVLDSTIAARQTRKQVKQFGRVCSWCVGAAIATAGVVYFARKAREADKLLEA